MKRRWMIWRWPLLGAILLVSIVGIVVRSPQALPQGVFATPTPPPTPTPFIPTPTPIPTPVPGAITILEEQQIICTVESQEAADELMTWQLQRAESQAPAAEEVLISAFERAVTQREARVGEMPLALTDAKGLLQEDAALLKTYIITQEVQSEIIPFETETREDKRIPYGARIVVQVGRTGLHSVTTTRRYSNGAPEGEPVVEESTLEPTAEGILVGTYIADTPDGNPGRSEGTVGRAGPEGFPLDLPVNGSIISNFGTRNRVMHYGIDLDCQEGDPVYAPGDGVVIFVGERASYGLMVEIAYGDGFVTRLAPFKQVSVLLGAEVTRGQQLGTAALPQDEEAQPHLHMELLIDGIPYNPRQYLN